MIDVDRLEQELLERARRGYSPSSVSEARVRRGALAAIATGAVVPTGSAAASLRALIRGVSNTVTVSRVVLVTLALAAAGAGGYALGLRDGRGSARGAVVLPPATKPAPALVQSPKPVEALSAVEVSSLPREGGASAVVSSAPSATAASSAEVELATLRRVERLLREDNPRFARALLNDLDQSVPRGKLMEERRAAAAVAACQLGSGAAAAASFDGRYPNSVYGARVHEACSNERAGGGDSERNSDRSETKGGGGHHE